MAVSMFTTFTGGVGSLVSLMFAVFTASGLFAYLMDSTGCAMSVGKTMVKWLGVDRAYLAITLTTVILLVAGVGTYMQVIVVLAIPLMKACLLYTSNRLQAAQAMHLTPIQNSLYKSVRYLDESTHQKRQTEIGHTLGYLRFRASDLGGLPGYPDMRGAVPLLAPLCLVPARQAGQTVDKRLRAT